MTRLTYRCPFTGLNIPLPVVLKSESADNAQLYEIVTCPACARLHRVSKATGQIIAENPTA